MENITGLNIQNHQASPRLVDIKIKNDYLDQVKQQFDQHDLIDIEYKPFLRFHITDIFNKVFDEKIQNLFNKKTTPKFYKSLVRKKNSNIQLPIKNRKNLRVIRQEIKKKERKRNDRQQPWIKVLRRSSGKL